MTSNPSGPREQPPSAPRPRVTAKDPASTLTRAGALWSSLIAGFLILILLLVFIAQNTASTPFTFWAGTGAFRWEWPSCWPPSGVGC
ncbi:hypothetical protein NIIDMKKI_79240 [Mycobacterium kansasii]|uniref:Uncharacterized protein n=1 Tax=Mycobacterium kansasii TaxID=1768 RepID=A0A7G1IV68_MYCKA|nr:hypothetical protein NIIDMKKI_79240 [Mycobacterium kansasii]